VWTKSGLTALVAGNLVKATATASGKIVSAFSNEVTVIVHTARHVKAIGGLTVGRGISLDSAWTHKWAVSVSNTVRQAGDTIYYHAGSYYTDNFSDADNSFNASGTAENPLIYRNWNNERVLLYTNNTFVNFGGPDYGYGVGYPAYIAGSYVWLWGFEIASYARPLVGTDTCWDVSNIRIAGNYDKVINCIIHDATAVGVTDQGAIGSEVVGNLIYYSGRQIGRDNGASPGGYSGYVQNASTNGVQKVWRENVMWANYSVNNICLYGTATIWNIKFTGNVMFNGGHMYSLWPGFCANIIAGPQDNDGGSRLDRDTILYNHFYNSESPVYYHDNDFGYHGDNPTYCRIDSNVMVGNADQEVVNLDHSNLVTSDPSGIQLIGNIIVGGQSGGLYPSDIMTHFPNNTWVASRATRTLDVYVRKNPYEPKRANVIIHNWQNADSVSFDPSSVLSSGDRYIVRSSTNYYEDTLATGIWTSGNIKIHMADPTMAAPFHEGFVGNAFTFLDPVNPAPYFATVVLLGGEAAQTTAPVVSSPIAWGATSVSGTSESGASVTIYKNGDSIGVTIASGTAWTKAGLTAFVQDDAIKAKATVAGKLQSEFSNTVIVPAQSQTTAPVVSSPIYVGATSVSGTSESGATVKIYVNGDSIGVTTATGTSWTKTGLTALSLNDLVKAKATASGKTESAFSNTVTVTYLSSFPVTLTNTPPEEVSLIFNVTKPGGVDSAFINMWVYDADWAAEGKLYVNGNDSLDLFGSNGNSGNDQIVVSFTMGMSASSWVNGDNILRFVHLSTAGFRIDSIKVTFDEQQTSAPIVNSPIRAGEDSVSGTSTEADGTVILVYVNNTPHGASTTVTAGMWKQKGLATLVKNDLVKAVATATGKTISEYSNTVIVSALWPIKHFWITR